MCFFLADVLKRNQEQTSHFGIRLFWDTPILRNTHVACNGELTLQETERNTSLGGHPTLSHVHIQYLSVIPKWTKYDFVT